MGKSLVSCFLTHGVLLTLTLRLAWGVFVSPARTRVTVGYGVFGWRGSNFPLSRRLSSSPLEQCLATVRVCDATDLPGRVRPRRTAGCRRPRSSLSLCRRSTSVQQRLHDAASDLLLLLLLLAASPEMRRWTAHGEARRLVVCSQDYTDSKLTLTSSAQPTPLSGSMKTALCDFWYAAP